MKRILFNLLTTVIVVNIALGNGEFETYIGGESTDICERVYVDSHGYIYVSGTTASDDFLDDTQINIIGDRSGEDLFITKVSPDGSEVIFTTIVAGNHSDRAYGGVWVDVDSNVYVSGFTESTDFPTTPNAFDTTANGGVDAFVLKLNKQGDELIYSTYLGGSGDEYNPNIKVNAEGKAYLVLRTASADFPVSTNGYDITHNGGSDIGIVVLSENGASVEYASYLGGSADDWAYNFQLDDAGNIYIPGYTESNDYPVLTDALFSSYFGNRDAVITKLNMSTNSLEISTYIGGNHADGIIALSIDEFGYIYSIGRTTSNNYPTTSNVYNTVNSGSDDICITKFSPNGDSIIASTYLGGASADYCTDIHIGNNGDLYLTGYTLSSDFPMSTDAANTLITGDVMGFYAKISSDCSDLIYSTYYGGSGSDQINYSYLMNNKLYLVGQTSSRNLSTDENSLYTSYNGGDFDAFIKVISIGEELNVIIDSESDSSINIYPNPANNYISIINHSDYYDCFYVISNINGQAILTDTINSEQIDISALDSGLYFLQIAGKTWKFLVE